MKESVELKFYKLDNEPLHIEKLNQIINEFYKGKISLFDEKEELHTLVFDFDTPLLQSGLQECIKRLSDAFLGELNLDIVKFFFHPKD